MERRDTLDTRRGGWLWIGLLLLAGCPADEREAGTIAGGARKMEIVAARDTDRGRAGASLESGDSGEGRASESKQILFGDLHVHTTYSIDAFMYSLPLWAGEGAHPPADACDFARYCAGLDFFSINDHSEGLTPDLWQRTKESIRECNAIAEDPENPDLVAYMGFEWTQTGDVPEEHYGHKNVIFPGLADDQLPKRPISAVPIGDRTIPPRWVIDAGASLIRFAGHPEYADLVSFMGGMAQIGDCAPDVDTRELPADCRENAETPEVLFRKLDEWGFESLVIPHGLAWGVHAPPGSRLDVQLLGAEHDPSKQRLIEISSGHGSGEEWRDHPEYLTNESGARVCPAPTSDYLPCCWQAGEIMRARCGEVSSQECEARVQNARQLALDAGIKPHGIFPDVPFEDWLDCDQCRDCFKPALDLRPGQTSQYSNAISNFDAGVESPSRFRWGYISSTDNHAARPATGYKQYERRIMSDARGFASPETEATVRGWVEGDAEEGAMPEGGALGRLAGLFDVERGASYLYPGGIAAVHATGRDRRSIWDALMRREVYGTSGPRMLLWFDLVNGPDGHAPMGSEVVTSREPRFVVRAAGAHVQRPGCPGESLDALSAERLDSLCRNECYYPGEERHLIEAIEVVRIRPQTHPDENVASLIEDPWRRFECPPDPAGCRVEFSDPEHPTSGRDALYYVRALQAETPAINAAGYRTRFDAEGNAISIDPCYAGYKTPDGDDCLAPARERAWSSPIYVDQPRAVAAGS